MTPQVILIAIGLALGNRAADHASEGIEKGVTKGIVKLYHKMHKAKYVKPTPPVQPPVRGEQGGWLCPECQRPLQMIGPHKEWICPIALEAQKRGLLSQPGRVHTAVWVWQEQA